MTIQYINRAAPFPLNPIASLYASREQGAWFDPSDLTTMFQDAAGTTPVTADGQPVGLIRDKSWRSNHASQATTARRPTYKTDGTHHWLAFDGTDDCLVTGNVNLSGGDKVTQITAVEPTVDTGTHQSFAEFSAATATNAGSFAMYWDRSSGLFNAYSRGTASPTASHAATKARGIVGAALMVATYDIAGDLSTMRFNGTAVPNGTADKGAGNFGNYPIYIGRRGGTSLPFSGKFFGLVIRAGLTAAPALTLAEGWMAAKMGLTL